MEPHTQRTVATVVAIILLLGAGYLIFKHSQGTPGSSTTSTSSPQTASTTPGGTTMAVSGTAGKSTVQRTNSAIPAPDFGAPLVCSSNTSPSQCALFQADAHTRAAALAKDSGDFTAWIQLGYDRQATGDYAGAARDLEYVSALYPTNGISFANLGDLYMNYLHDYPKAESSYLTEIKNDPGKTNSYRALFQLYTTVYKTNSPAAETVLKQGIAVDSKAVDLQVMLARYYRSQGRTSQAKTEYLTAVATAQSLGESSLAAQIQQEESKI
jgi:Tfp pilus assembly protein PilF